MDIHLLLFNAFGVRGSLVSLDDLFICFIDDFSSLQAAVVVLWVVNEAKRHLRVDDNVFSVKTTF